MNRSKLNRSEAPPSDLSSLPVVPSNIETMERLMAKSVAPRRFNLLLLGAFALVGLALAGVGLYGVMSYT
ncbi:MAG TPA: hypothetical protein VG324_16545, partial [Blastocatellia bacterium]|nr:hypothetical protein [Blastocatellia bacterium]